ncbi:expressed unknown protein [Seminavis robusta]|uniref:Uncharacterized protein n=1 Tax=Seminavis robusta TaxID=568900 RepID=A0A9N8D6T4_9STRA|nr:expressed unknown protein [Seminavis robusta]|eukprot:Sro21_g014690.1 n/a (122) ;mRNA; r:79452-79817
MYDWKRSKHGILQNKNSYWGRPGKSPLHKLKDTNYYKYSMQLNLYRELLERFYEFKVSNMFIVRFHPSSDTYEKVKVGRMEAETNALLEHRQAETNALLEQRHDDLDGEEALVAGVLALNI